MFELSQINKDTSDDYRFIQQKLQWLDHVAFLLIFVKSVIDLQCQ